MLCSQVLIFFFFFSLERRRKKNNLIQLKQIPAVGISSLLAAIKVKAGTTLIKVSLLLLLLSPLFLPSRCLWLIFNGLVTMLGWQPLHLLYPETSRLCKTAPSSHHISLCCCHLCTMTPAQLQGHAKWKIICVKTVVWRWKIVKWRKDVTRWKIHVLWTDCCLKSWKQDSGTKLRLNVKANLYQQCKI